MARERGYVYYEADATFQFINPFVDVHADNPSLAGFEGKALKVCRSRTSIHSVSRGSHSGLLLIPSQITYLEWYNQFETASRAELGPP